MASLNKNHNNNPGNKFLFDNIIQKFASQVLIFTIISSSLFAQETNLISGKITDANGLPLPACSVFIANTSKGTISNADGQFELINPPLGTYDLIISCIGFETQVYTYKAAELPLKLIVQLKQKETELTAVFVEPYEKNGWNKWGNFFLQNFIGVTENAKNCTIKNIKIIHFRFSKKNNELNVFADEPLIIINKALGYNMKYQMEEFKINFRNHITFFSGYPLFQEISVSPKKEIQTELKRQKAYYGSLRHFMKSLYHHELTEEGFQVIKTTKVPYAEKERVKALYKLQIPEADTFEVRGNDVVKINKPLIFSPDSLAYYDAILDKPDFYDKNELINEDSLFIDDKNKIKLFFFTGNLHVIYKNTKEGIYGQSDIYLTTTSGIELDENGVFYPPKAIVVNGYWGINEKIANQLPVEYKMNQK